MASFWPRQIWLSGVSLKRSWKMQFTCVDLLMIWPQVQISFSPDFSIVTRIKSVRADLWIYNAEKCFAGFFNITSLLVKRQRGKSKQCFFVEGLPNVTGQKFFLPFFSKGRLILWAKIIWRVMPFFGQIYTKVNIAFWLPCIVSKIWMTPKSLRQKEDVFIKVWSMSLSHTTLGWGWGALCFDNDGFFSIVLIESDMKVITQLSGAFQKQRALRAVTSLPWWRSRLMLRQF